MRKLFSTKYSAGAFNTAILLLRLVFGILMASHGYDKLTHFDQYSKEFMDFMGLGKSVSLSLTIFAEFFCSLLVCLGLFTRLATIPLIIGMSVVVFKVAGGDVFGHGETGAMYLGAFLVLLIVGPGRISVDSLISK